jgi:hypothetical protein
MTTALVALFFLMLIGFSLVSVNGLVGHFRVTKSHALALHAWDFVFVSIGAALFLAICVLEVRFHALRRVLSGDSPGALAVLVAAIVLWFAHALFAPGLLVTGDAGSHVARVSHLAMALRGGDSLYWDNSFFGGGTALQFTGPLFHWLAALICLVIGDATAAVKIEVIAGRCLSAWFFWLFLRRIGLGRTAAALGALFYGGAFFQTAVAESVRSNFPQIINLVCLPATLFFLEQVLRERRVLTSAWIGLCLTAIVFIGNHQPTAVMAAVFIAPYGLVRAFMVKADVRRLIALAAAGAVVTVGSTAFVVPFLAEKSWTAEAFSPAVLHFHMPLPNEFYNFLVWGATAQGSLSSSYLGLSVLACVAAGVFLCLTRVCRRDMRLLLAVCIVLAVCTLLLGGSYVRQALFTMFFVTAAASVSVQILLEALPGLTALPVLILAAFLVDLGPTAIQPWVRPDMRPLQQAGAALEEAAAGSRVIETEYGPAGFFISVGPDSSPLNYARVQMLYGPHKMEASKGHNAMVAVLQIVQDDLNRTGSLRPDTAGLLGLYNVGWIVGHQKNRMGLPRTVPGTVPDDVIGAHLRIVGATPFLVSGRLDQAVMPADFGGPPFWQNDFLARTPRAEGAEAAAQTAFAAMQVDLPERQAAQFLVQTVPDWGHVSGAAPHARLVDYRVWPGRVRLVVESDGAGFLRLSHPFYPALHVTENGVAVQAVPDVFSMMVVPVRAGQTDIEVVARPSGLRVVCWWIYLIAALGLVGALVKINLLGKNRKHVLF